MNTIEFEAKIEDGIIVIPKNLQNQITQYVKVIVSSQSTQPKTAQQPTALEKLQASGLVGCGQGDSHLSENYKTELQNILDEKM